MKIYINDHRKLFGIQEKFSALFPNLRISFFAKAPHEGDSFSHHLVAGGKTIGQCRTIHNKGILTLTGQMTAADVTDHFRDIFGLTIRLFQRKENEWKEIPLDTRQTLTELSNQASPVKAMA